MKLTRRSLLGTAMAASALPHARAQDAPALRIGVLGDQSGPYRDFSGPVSVACARQAIADFGQGRMKVEVLVERPSEQAGHRRGHRAPVVRPGRRGP